MSILVRWDLFEAYFEFQVDSSMSSQQWLATMIETSKMHCIMFIFLKIKPNKPDPKQQQQQHQHVSLAVFKKKHL